MVKIDARLQGVSKICLALSETTIERHGSHAAFLVGKKKFAYYLNNHHGDALRLDVEEIDWEEVRELLYISYRRIAPRRLAMTVRLESELDK